MKRGKRILKKIQGWASPAGHQTDHATSSSQHCFSVNSAEMLGGTTCNDPTANKSLPTWQIRRRNKSILPRPKSTGYLKDFNILSAEDDVGDDSNRAYDDFVLAQDSAGKHDRLLNDTMSSRILVANESSECTMNGYYGGQGVSSSGKKIPGRDDFILTRDVSGRAAYWQRREDESNKTPVMKTSSSIMKNWKTPSQIRQLKHEVDTKEMTQFIYDKGVANRAAMWQKLEDDHFEKMMINPDKEWKGPAIRVVLDKNHPEYGTPPKGSKTEKRGIKAYKHVVKEIGELCKIIAENGDPQADGTVTITFRKLFHTYVPISNKVVGLLIRARKRGLLHFNGEMLYQRQDEDEVVRLFSLPDELE